MTGHQWRAPGGVRAGGCALKIQGTQPLSLGTDFSAEFRLNAGISGIETPDLFDQSVSGSVEPHPDFLARAEIWRLQSEGAISLAEAQRRSAAVGIVTVGKSDSEVSRLLRKTPRPRHSRPAPRASRQYAGHMATTAARDDRLTPGARAFLQVLRARCGKGRTTAITKGAAANLMSRSTRTIRRYLIDLVRFGYVELETQRTARGLHVGLVVRLTERVLPFFEEAKGLASWLAEKPAALLAPFRPFKAVLSSTKPGVTLPSPNNQSLQDSFRKGRFSEAMKGWRSGAVMPPRPS